MTAPTSHMSSGLKFQLILPIQFSTNEPGIAAQVGRSAWDPALSHLLCLLHAAQFKIVEFTGSFIQ